MCTFFNYIVDQNQTIHMLAAHCYLDVMTASSLMYVSCVRATFAHFRPDAGT